MPGASRHPRRTGRVRAATGAFVRWVRATVRWVRATPVVLTYAAVLLVTTLVLRLASSDLDDSLLTGSSTDVAHLAHDPLVVLVASALFLPGMQWLPEGLVLLTIGRSLERRVGSWRTLLVLASGHVVGTALTELPIAVAIGLHGLPDSDATRSDVGASYALVAGIAAFTGLLPRLVRLPVFLVGALLVAGMPVIPPDMTTWGHLIASATGVAWWHHLRRRAADPDHAPDDPDEGPRHPAREGTPRPRLRIRRRHDPLDGPRPHPRPPVPAGPTGR